MTDSDSDDWEDSRDPVEKKQGPFDIRLPVFNLDERQSIPLKIPLRNFNQEERGSKSLYRCEPANKKYPGIDLSIYKDFTAVYLSIMLLNSTENVFMRVPDFKTKEINFLRRENIMFLKPQLESIFFKKKSQDKVTKKDIAFELGKGFLSHTLGSTPQFIFIAIPYKDGKFEMNLIGKSEAFHVFSKRQDRFLDHSNKRQKKNTEIEKLDTDIQGANTTLNTLNCRNNRLTQLNAQYSQFFESFQHKISSIEDETIKIALQYALRVDEQETFTDL
jgi:hypothetical protein